MHRAGRGALVGNEMEVAVANAPLRDHPIGHRPDVDACTSQYRNLQAGVVIDVRMERRYGQLVMGVLLLGQPPSQVSDTVVVDVADHSEARSRLDSGRLPTKRFPHEVAQSLGAAGVSPLLRTGIERLEKVIVERHGHPLQRSYPPE